MTPRPTPLLGATTALALSLALFVPFATSAQDNTAPAEDDDAITVSFQAGEDEDLSDRLRGASLLISAVEGDEVTDPQELVAAAQADYRRLVAALYDQGYYSGAVSITIDGRQASSLSVLRRGVEIRQIAVDVEPGPRFAFSRADVTPLPEDAEENEDFRVGAPARTSVMRNAANDGVDAWRNDGYALAEVSDQQITADHRSNSVAAAFRIATGPQLTFAPSTLDPESADSAVRAERILQIAGIPAGELYSADEVDRAATRLRRTGAFASAVVTEADTAGPGNTLATEVAVEDARPRRIGFGAEIATTDGLTLSSYWMHRNLLGGAERLRIDGEVGDIGSDTGGIDYSLTASLTKPAFRHPDMDLVYSVEASHNNEPSYTTDVLAGSVGVDRYLTEKLTAKLSTGLRFTSSSDNLGDREFFHFTLTGGLTWDNRDNVIDPTKGIYASGSVMPFVGLSGSDTGLRTLGDLRGYQQLGSDRLVLAGRVQVGNVAGATINGTPSDWLFYSGGGGSVRGHGYQSLGVNTGGVTTGGQSYLALSTEVRGRIGESWGAVAFVDYGYVAAEETYSGGQWQGGAGVGVRYFTPIGPIRLDVAMPVTNSSNAVSMYIGIGQAF